MNVKGGLDCVEVGVVFVVEVGVVYVVLGVEVNKVLKTAVILSALELR